jgi:hypothetical protein
VALADWTFSKNRAGLTSAIDGTNPLVGAGSLLLTNTSDLSYANIQTMHCVYTANKGFTRGRLRTLIKVHSSTVRGMFGVYFMASQADVTASGSCYYATLVRDLNAGTRTLRVDKVTSGLDQQYPSGTPTTFATVSSAFSVDTTKALEVEWVSDAAVLAGTRIIVRTGDQTDFSDLAEVMDYTDTTSPLTTTVGEGLCWMKWDVLTGAGFAEAEARYDQTTVVQMA